MMQLHSSSSSTLHVVSVLIKLGITTAVAVWMGNPLSLMLCPFSVFRSKRSMTVTEEKPHDGLCKSLPRCSKCDFPQSLSRSVYIWSRALSIKMSLSVSALCLIPLPSTHNPTYTRAHNALTHTHTHTHTHTLTEHLIRLERLVIEQAKRRWANETYNILFSSHPSGCHSRELKKWKHKRSK